MPSWANFVIIASLLVNEMIKNTKLFYKMSALEGEETNVGSENLS